MRPLSTNTNEGSVLGVFPAHMAWIRGLRAGRRRPSKPTPAPCKPTYSVSDPHIYVALEAGNRNAGSTDRPSPLPARWHPG